MPGNRKKETRNTDSRSSVLAGQHPCPHITSSHDCCDWMWIWNPSSSPILSWYGSFRLISVPKTEIPSSWYTVWKQWRHHRGSKRVLGGPGKGLLFWRDKKAWTDGLSALPWREIILKSNGQFFFSLVAWSTRGWELFDLPLLKWK